MAKTTIYLSKTLHGRKLIVHITGPATGGKIRVSYTARYHNKTIASGTKTAKLTNGRSTVIFKLSARAAAHATIRVRAQLEHDTAVQNTRAGSTRLTVDVLDWFILILPSNAIANAL